MESERLQRGPSERRSGPRRWWCGACVAAVVLLVVPSGSADSGAAAVEAPRKVVQETLDKVLHILNQPELDGAERRERIQQVAFEVFDFRTMGKLALARNWKKLSAEQQTEYVSEFKQHLARRYGTRLDRYRQTDVEVVGTRQEPRGDVVVQTSVVGGQFDGVEMDYRMRRRPDGWKVIDVVIENVSLVANFRAQFAEIMSNGGVDRLLNDLRTKNFGGPEGD